MIIVTEYPEVASVGIRGCFEMRQVGQTKREQSGVFVNEALYKALYWQA
jgi:hypothetical protein